MLYVQIFELIYFDWEDKNLIWRISLNYLEVIDILKKLENFFVWGNFLRGMYMVDFRCLWVCGGFWLVISGFFREGYL